VRIGGAWVGLGLGDSSEEIRRIKTHMRRKFSYAKTLADTSLFDQPMAAAVTEMQARYKSSGQIGVHTPGIINAETKYAMGFLPRPPKADTRPVLLTVAGTGVPWWVGPDADTARAVEPFYLWQPVGYPAQAVPMGPSIKAGRDELYVQINRHRDRITKHGFALAGYSQGALIISETWELDVKPQNGRLHWALPHITKAVTWGNPMRERGKVWPDAGAPPSKPSHGGLTGILMADTPDWWRNYAHHGDLYCDVPPDESGENRVAIWQIIRNGNMISGPDSLLRQLLELGGVVKDADQISEVTGMFKAMIDALTFFGQRTGPHLNYSTREAIEYLKAA
jgi:hypothetical protein